MFSVTHPDTTDALSRRNPGMAWRKMLRSHLKRNDDMAMTMPTT